ncbi:hypothetical protein [Methylobacterium nigriterrae]|uniref:hypothetical protein n=1 Tax=Methylobacterium nigriterrae TaxID=3127512 RepID=UPI003013E6A3
MTNIVDLFVLNLCDQAFDAKNNRHDDLIDAISPGRIFGADETLLPNDAAAGSNQRIAKLEAQLALAQDDMAEMALRFGAAQGEVASLRAQLMVTQVDRDAWRAQAERLSIPFPLRAWRQRRAG